MKSPKGNDIRERSPGRFEELVAGGWRKFNPKRQQRKVIERTYGIRGGRQWKKLRRALRAQGRLA